MNLGGIVNLKVNNVCNFIYENNVLIVWKDNVIIKCESIENSEDIEEELLELEEQGYILKKILAIKMF